MSSDIRKSIIKVTRRMSYTSVYKILSYLESSDKNDNGCEQNSNEDFSKSDIEEIMQYEPYFSHFKLMEELASILKNKRKKDGSLDLDVPESKIILDENGVAVDVKKYELTFANEIIEQFMLIANETVAEKFYWLEAPFIYRVHPAPDIEKIRELNTFIWNLGYRIKAGKDNIHPKASNLKKKPSFQTLF